MDPSRPPRGPGQWGPGDKAAVAGLAALILALASLGGFSMEPRAVRPGLEPALPPPRAPAPPAAPLVSLPRRQAALQLPEPMPEPEPPAPKPEPPPPPRSRPKPKAPAARTPAPQPVSPGRQARIVPGSVAFLAVDQQAFSELREQGKLRGLVRDGLLFTAPPGAIVQVLETDGRQALVRTGGRVGWVAVTALEPAAP